MAVIKRYPFGIRHLRTSSTSYVSHEVNGGFRHHGTGISFWFRALDSALSEVPVDDRELSMVARARTLDLQEVTAQVSVSYRFTDGRLASRRVDFAIDPVSGTWTGSPLEQVGSVIGELVNSATTEAFAELDVRAAIVAGARDLRAKLTADLTQDERIAGMGIEVLDARVGAVRADADLEAFLRTPAREAAQSDADRATYARRAQAVDQERAIAENELGNRIELATREQELVASEGANARRRAEEAAAAALITARSDAELEELRSASTAESIRRTGAARGDAAAAELRANNSLTPELLTAVAMRELAQNLPSIESLTVTPDILTKVLSQLSRTSDTSAP